MILDFAVTTWCNDTCAYCVTTVQQCRDEATHAFVRHDVGPWPLATAVRCPQPACLRLDRYAFLEGVPTRGRSFDLLAEDVADGPARQH